jgi:DNA polymerase-3 subunit gamma/tau
MLGLSDRGAIRRCSACCSPATRRRAAAVKEQYDLGVEPAALLRGLLEACTASPAPRSAAPQDPAQSVEEREAYADWASRLGYATVHRLWQLLLKGLGEVNSAAMPLEAAEMALLRVIHASELPDPGALPRKAAERRGGAAAAPRPARPPPPARRAC